MILELLTLRNLGMKQTFKKWIQLTCITLTFPLSAAEPPAAANLEPLTVSETARQLDALFRRSWQTEAVTPAPLSGDSEFLRRVYLDLAGRIPAVSERREFVASTEPDKRKRIVSELLDQPGYVRHFTTVWRNALIPQAASQPELRGVIPGFEAWLWKHLSEGSAYDLIVREIITAELNGGQVSPGIALASTTSPDAFFVVRELKPENLAAGTARAFLGVRLDCAQCHDHPFDKWSQKQFWNVAAFFSGFARPEADDDDPGIMMRLNEDIQARSITIPGTGDLVPAIFLNGQQPDWTAAENRDVTTREALADWIVARDNPYFAHMAANRIWSQFFGQGIVHPVDDFSESNPASHPEVLDLLAAQFIAHDYDLQFLIQTIAATDVYQLTSEQTHATQAEPSHFARSALRGMTPEQMFDSLAEAVGFYQPYRSNNPFVIDTDSPRARFLDLFRNDAESPLDRETTILQALTMMNGDFVDNATNLDDSRTLKAITEFPLMAREEKLETLFLAALSRVPSEAERDRLLEYLQTGGPEQDEEKALSDIFWALLNSSEFLFNH